MYQPRQVLGFIAAGGYIMDFKYRVNACKQIVIGIKVCFGLLSTLDSQCLILTTLLVMLAQCSLASA